MDCGIPARRKNDEKVAICRIPISRILYIEQGEITKIFRMLGTIFGPAGLNVGKITEDQSIAKIVKEKKKFLIEQVGDNTVCSMIGYLERVIILK